MAGQHPDSVTSRDDSTDITGPGRDELADADACGPNHQRQPHDTPRGDRDPGRSPTGDATPLPSEGESNYPASPPTQPAQHSDLQVELPDHDPRITPGAATALLRLILKAARHPT